MTKCFVTAALAVLLSACGPDPRPAPAPNKMMLAEEKAAARAQAIANCEVPVEELKAEYEALTAQRKFEAAAEVLRGCAKRLDVKALHDKVATAQQLAYLEQAKNANAPPGPRIVAIERLKREYPAKANELSKELAALRAEIEKGEEPLLRVDKATLAAQKKRIAQELAERKKRGVSIGMTKEEVLQSSWGRPTPMALG